MAFHLTESVQENTFVPPGHGRPALRSDAGPVGRFAWMMRCGLTLCSLLLLVSLTSCSEKTQHPAGEGESALPAEQGQEGSENSMGSEGLEIKEFEPGEGAEGPPAGSPGIPLAVLEYADALKALEDRSGNGHDVEHLFILGQVAREALLHSFHFRVPAVLERLTDEEFTSLQTIMKGFVFVRGEAVMVEPDGEFFLSLARRRGRREDVAFFEMYRDYFERPGWPRFVMQTWDAGGCTRYGTLALTEAYGKVSEYRKRFPSHYARTVADLVGRVRDELLFNTQACGDQVSVVREYEAFLRTYPKVDVAVQVEKRLAGIRNGTVTMRYHEMPPYSYGG